MKINKKIKIVLLIIASIIFIVGLIFGKFYYSNFIKSNTNNCTSEAKMLYLYRNSDTRKVLNQIIERGIVRDTNGLYDFMIRKNYRGRNIVSGKYKIPENWTNNQLINSLRAGNGRIDTKIIMTQARDLGQVAKKLSREILLDSAKVYHFLTNRDSMSKYGFSAESQIAMFIANTYFVDWDITNRELMDRMYQEYEKFWNQDRSNKAKSVGLSKQDVINLASIVYWETKKAEDMPIVAGVYMNRLKIGMPLQADPTLIFALGDYSIKRLYQKDFAIESPYNTYKYPGLPPGPILIPPIKFIDAVLNYTKHNYLYFVAKEDFSGYSYFAETYSEHLEYAKRYQDKMRELKINR